MRCSHGVHARSGASSRPARAHADRVPAPLPPRPQRGPRAPARDAPGEGLGHANTSTRSTTYASTCADYATSLGDDRDIPSYIRTERGLGYRFIGPVACWSGFRTRVASAGPRWAPATSGRWTARSGRCAMSGPVMRPRSAARRRAWVSCSPAGAGARGFVLGVADGASGCGRRRSLPPRFGRPPSARPGPFAVRSSAVGEDGDERSFAGMYELVLGVAPDASRMPSDRVRRERPTAGSRVRPDAGARMAVIVQRMVVARAAAAWRSRRPDHRGPAIVRRDRRSRSRGAAGLGPDGRRRVDGAGRHAHRATDPRSAPSTDRERGASRSRPG